MSDQNLYIITCVSNPIRWKSRITLARLAINSWLQEPNVHVVLVECAAGGRSYELADLADDRVTHVPVRNTTLVWNKENLLNLGIHRLPHSAKFIGTFDADIIFRKSGWANETIQALQIYPVIQPWSAAYDLGPNDSHIQVHRSFCSIFHDGGPVVPTDKNWWKHDAGPYEYPHSGYAWAWQRDILDRIGGLFEVGGMGSGDHHMALGMTGHGDKSVPSGTHPAYLEAVMQWQQRALTHINQKLGYVAGTIEHPFHGSKAKRGYLSRWEMFVQHVFNPHTDLKKNSYGVLEWAGNKPDLERQFDNYLRSRDEDANTMV